MKVELSRTFSVFRNMAVFPRVAVIFGGDVKICVPGLAVIFGGDAKACVLSPNDSR
jgi:hypothetical protein